MQEILDYCTFKDVNLQTAELKDTERWLRRSLVLKKIVINFYLLRRENLVSGSEGSVTSLEFRQLWTPAALEGGPTNMATETPQESQSAKDWQKTRETVRERTAFLFNNSLLSDIKFVVTESTQVGSHNELDDQDDSSPGEEDSDSQVEDVSSVESVSDDSAQVEDDLSAYEVSASQVELVNSDGNVSASQVELVNSDADVRQVRIPAHKLVLAISSPVFEAMFYGDLAEKGNEVELPDTESDYLLEFLRFLYCDEAKLTAENVFGVLYLAEKYIVPCLAAKCWSFIDEHPSVCLKSNRAVSTLDHGTLVSLLKRDSLCIKEFALFKAVKHWAEAKCKVNGLEPNGKTMREVLGEAVDLIRFPAMSLKDFAGKVVRGGILTSDEALEVHQYFAREVAAQDIKFPTSYRAGLASTACVHEYCTYDKEVKLQSTKTSPFLPEEGNLDLMVESRNVHLRGVCLLTSKKKGQEFSATVRLLDANRHELATETGRFRAKRFSEGNDFCGFDVKFAVPVLLWKSSRYRIRTEVKTCKREEPFHKVSKEPSWNASVSLNKSFHFIFSGKSHHIFKLLFHKLD